VLALNFIFGLSKFAIKGRLACVRFHSLYRWYRLRGGLPFVFIRKDFFEVFSLVDIEKRVESILRWLGCRSMSLPSGKLGTGVTFPFTPLHNHLSRLGSYRH